MPYKYLVYITVLHMSPNHILTIDVIPPSMTTAPALGRPLFLIPVRQSLILVQTSNLQLTNFQHGKLMLTVYMLNMSLPAFRLLHNPHRLRVDRRDHRPTSEQPLIQILNLLYRIPCPFDHFRGFKCVVPRADVRCPGQAEDVARLGVGHEEGEAD